MIFKIFKYVKSHTVVYCCILNTVYLNTYTVAELWSSLDAAPMLQSQLEGDLSSTRHHNGWHAVYWSNQESVFNLKSVPYKNENQIKS